MSLTGKLLLKCQYAPGRATGCRTIKTILQSWWQSLHISHCITAIVKASAWRISVVTKRKKKDVHVFVELESPANVYPLTFQTQVGDHMSTLQLFISTESLMPQWLFLRKQSMMPSISMNQTLNIQDCCIHRQTRSNGIRAIQSIISEASLIYEQERHKLPLKQYHLRTERYTVSGQLDAS